MGKFIVQNFITKNYVYAKTVIKDKKNKIWVFRKEDMIVGADGILIPKDKSIKPERIISTERFRSEAILHQRRAIVSDIMKTKHVSYKDANKIFNIEKEKIKQDRIMGIMVQENMNKKNAVALYNDLVVHKKFSDLKKYGSSPNLEVTYKF